MAQEIDWSGIKANAIALQSVNAAGTLAASQLPPEEAKRLKDRINKRAYRERWLDQAEALALTAPTNAKPLSKPVQTGAESMANALANDSEATRIGFSKAARKVAEKLPTLDDAALLDKDTAQSAKHWQGIAAGTHGWDRKEESAAVMVNVALLVG